MCNENETNEGCELLIYAIWQPMIDMKWKLVILLMTKLK